MARRNSRSRRRRTAEALGWLILVALVVLARYNPGLLDGRSRAGGKVTDSSGTGSDDQAGALVLQPDGKLVAAGRSAGAGSGDFALVRYNPNGSLDGSFGTGGKVTTDFSGAGSSDEALALVLQPDGKLVAAGRSAAAGSTDFALARYNPDGSLDGSFGTGGKVTTDFSGAGSYDEAFALVLQPDGKLVAAGRSAAAGNTDFALARYDPNGSLDGSFGTGGKVTTDFSGAGTDDQARALVLQPDGKLVAAGRSAGAGNTDFALARYDPNGSLDGSFGTGGKVTADFGGAGSSGEASALVLRPDGKLVAAGLRKAAGRGDFALARYNSDGGLDSGTGAKVTTDFSGGGGSSDEASALVLRPDGKLVAAGLSKAAGSTDFALARYNPDGSLDSGTGAKVTTDFSGLGSYDEASALVLQPDGKLVAAGRSAVAGRGDFALARYNPDGSLDGSFGTVGKVTTDFSGAGKDDQALR